MAAERRGPRAQAGGARSESVALVSSSVEGVRDCGSGFCVRCIGDESFVVTCRHVVLDLDSGSGELRVNGLPAREIANGDAFGVDLSILLVAAALPPMTVVPNEEPKVGAAVSSVGFRHLHGDHYFSGALRGRVDRHLTVRRQLSASGAPSFRIAAQKGFEFGPGASGSPICNAEGAVVGVLAFASRDGAFGYALSSSKLPLLLPALLPLAPAGSGPEASTVTRDIQPPPALPRVTDPTDLQKGRFGGQPVDGAIELSARLERVVGKSYFIFDATVRTIRSGITLEGPARFFLHDTYPRSTIEVRKPDPDGSLTLREVHAYGVFTLGCQVRCSDGTWHSVELDLTVLGLTAGLPDVFLNR